MNLEEVMEEVMMVEEEVLMVTVLLPHHKLTNQTLAHTT